MKNFLPPYVGKAADRDHMDGAGTSLNTTDAVAAGGTILEAVIINKIDQFDWNNRI